MWKNSFRYTFAIYLSSIFEKPPLESVQSFSRYSKRLRESLGVSMISFLVNCNIEILRNSGGNVNGQSDD